MRVQTYSSTQLLEVFQRDILFKSFGFSLLLRYISYRSYSVYVGKLSETDLASVGVNAWQTYHLKKMIGLIPL